MEFVTNKQQPWRGWTLSGFRYCRLL